jgi:hypothetical protein
MARAAWDDAAYLGSVNADTIDDEALLLVQRVSDRIVQGGNIINALAGSLPRPATAEVHDGKPAVGWETHPVAAQTDAGYKTLAWVHDGTTVTVKTAVANLLIQYGPNFNGNSIINGLASAITDEDSDTQNAMKLETSGNIIGPVGFRFEGLANAAVLRTAAYDALPQDATYVPMVLYKAPEGTGMPARVMTRVRITAGVRPVGADLQYEIRYIAAPVDSPDPFVDGSSALLQTITLTDASDDYSVELASLTDAIAVGGEIIAKCITAGSAADVTFHIQVET